MSELIIKCCNGFNIRQIQDVIDHSEKFNIEGAILFLDFTKAFDSLEWSFMTECLEKFGFKSSFLRWTRTMYTDIKGCILNNGWVSATNYRNLILTFVIRSM